MTPVIQNQIAQIRNSNIVEMNDCTAVWQVAHDHHMTELADYIEKSEVKYFYFINHDKEPEMTYPISDERIISVAELYGEDVQDLIQFAREAELMGNRVDEDFLIDHIRKLCQYWKEVCMKKFFYQKGTCIAMKFIDYHMARKCILPVLINRTAVYHFPDDIVSINFFNLLDLSVVFIYIPASGKEKSAFVNNKLLDSFCISKDRNYSKIILYFDAITNARRKQPASICKIIDLLLLPEWLKNELDSKIYVLSTQYGNYGASAMLDKRILERFAARIGESFNIIPSSVHEVLLIPDSVGISPEDLCQMLIEVNSSVLLPDEVLSTSIYRFDRTADELFVLQTK